MYLPFGISISSSFCDCNSLGDFVESLVILSAILLSIKSSVSNDWLFWSVNHTSIARNSELNVFKTIWAFGLPNGFLEQMYTKLLNLFAYHYCQYYNELILLH